VVNLKLTYRKILLSFFIIVHPLLLLAQGVPCGEDHDPQDNDCPLDTWIILLVIITLIFTVIHLHRKQKSLQALTPEGI
jgi:hypothetical protein